MEVNVIITNLCISQGTRNDVSNMRIFNTAYSYD